MSAVLKVERKKVIVHGDENVGWGRGRDVLSDPVIEHVVVFEEVTDF